MQSASKQTKSVFAASLILLLALTLTSAALAGSSALIDFEGLAEGTIVSSVASGSGISGDPVAGSVSVFGFHPRRAGNHAMIYDGTCTGGCSGGDTDLFFPALGNILIISQDLDSSDPDDADLPGMRFEFDFSGWGPGIVTVNSLTIGDVESDEAGGTIEIYGGGALLATIGIPVTGDNGLAVVPIGVSGADFLKVNLQGSAAIDNIEIMADTPPGGDEGCTPGYWKNHTDSWVGYTTDQNYEAVFGVDASFDKTLLGAAQQGGGGEKALGRHAVAALLNAANPGVDYAFTESEVIAMVQQAYASGDFEGIKNTLEAENELGCPLN